MESEKANASLTLAKLLIFNPVLAKDFLESIFMIKTFLDRGQFQKYISDADEYCSPSQSWRMLILAERNQYLVKV